MKLPLILVASLTLLAALTLATPSPVLEKPDLSREALRELSTHVVQGQVNALYTRTEEDGDWLVTHHLAEVAISRVQKGEGLEAGSLEGGLISGEKTFRIGVRQRPDK